MGLFSPTPVVADNEPSPTDRPARRRPFANFVKRLANFSKSDDKEKKSSWKNEKQNGSAPVKQKKHGTFAGRNNPYPESGHLREPHQSSQPSFGASVQEDYESMSYGSVTGSNNHDRDGPGPSNRSGAPTLATNAETLHSEAGQSRTVTTSTGAGALSSIDGVGANSTFSSPNHSDHSLATTLTTIQSNANTPNLGATASGHGAQQHGIPNGTMFSHQYPVSSGPNPVAVSAIPRHLHTDSHAPNTYGSATANNLLSDNASILTLASSSKRRRRSMDTDASVRAIAPGSVFGSSRESLPLSVLSGQPDGTRQSIGGIPGGSAAAAERASVYSSSGMVRDVPGASAPSERNSYYEKRVPGDAKSLRSITNIKDDSRSIGGMDSRSQYDGKSMHDVASLRSFDARSIQPPNERDSLHARNGSIPGSIGNAVNTPSLLRQTSTGGVLDISRRNSDWGNDDEMLEERKEN